MKQEIKTCQSCQADFQIEPEQAWLPAAKSISDWSFEGFYKIMLHDRIRVEAYKNAISEVVKQDDVVLDLGTGTGILAKFALEMGASRVYGIEMQDIGKKAEESLKKDFAGKFKLKQDVSYNVSLPEKVDIILSEIIGNIGDNENLCEILNDAQVRFLKQGGKMLPMKIDTFLCPVSSKKIHMQIKNQEFQIYPGCTYKKSQNPFNSYYDSLIPKIRELANPDKINTFNFDGNDDVSYKKNLEFIVLKDGLLTGFKGYFIAKLSPKVDLNISGETIGKNASISWQHAYLPISNPFEVKEEDKIKLTFIRESRGGIYQPYYSWKGIIYRDNVSVHQFEQSSN